MLSVRGICIGVPRIIDHLIFMTQGGVSFFCHEVLKPAIAIRRDFPIPFQVEIIEFLVRDDVSAVFAKTMQPSVLNSPSLLRRRFLFEATPTLQILAIEQKLPPTCFFLFRNLVWHRIGSWRCTVPLDASTQQDD